MPREQPLNKVNPLHHNISIHIRHTVLYTFFYGADEMNLFHEQEAPLHSSTSQLAW